MAVIGGLGGAAAPRTAPVRRAGAGGAGGFRVATDGAAGAAAGPAGAAAVSMPSLLGLQEALGDAADDRDARRQADEMLDALRALQRALLDGGDGAAAALGRLARRMTPAADPGLRAVQRAVGVRAAVEEARRRIAASL